MGNERSGRGGIPTEKFDAAKRMLKSGRPRHEVARELNIDRKTISKIDEGTHIFDQPGRLVDCPVCGRRVHELPCMHCCVTPLEVEPVKIDPHELAAAEVLYEREETARDLFPELVRSVQQLGMIQPPVVVRVRGGDKWLVILGGRRIQAALEAGLPSILCLEARANRHRQYDALLTDEWLRADRNPIERARMLQAALDDPEVAHTQKTLGERIGKSQAYVSAHIKLLALPDYWRDLIISRRISVEHARCLVPLAGDKQLLSQIHEAFLRADDGKGEMSRAAFRQLVQDQVDELARKRGRDEAAQEESPLDELIQPRISAGRRATATKDLRFKFSETAAEQIELRLAAIGEAEECESPEQTLEFLVDYYWQTKPRTTAARAADLGLKLWAA